MHKKAIPRTFPTVYTERDDSKFFTQTFFNLEETSTYIVKFIAEFITREFRGNKTATAMFHTPGYGKIHNFCTS